MRTVLSLLTSQTHQFFSQGDNFEEARDNLRDAIEGNLVVALQLGFEIPKLVGVEIKEFEYAEADAAPGA